MNLLITNTRNAQAYAIIRALRPHVKKIVATMEGDNRLSARLSHAANSRLVDRRYYTPLPAKDWRAGKIQRENTEIEEAYIQAVLKICEKEKIDAIFPSFDPHVYVFSKNRERFERLGVVLPVPDYEIVIAPLDKYQTIKAAEEAGFPCPRSYLPESEEDLKRIAEELGFPLVVKPRFTAAGRGTGIARDMPGLLEKVTLVSKSQGMPVIQEYIPGNQRFDIHLVVGRQGHLKTAFCMKVRRTCFRISLNLHTVTESLALSPWVEHAARLAKGMGWWGGSTLQTKIDPRDGIPKLLEINPRLGYGLWERTELGINEPLACLKIAKGEEVDDGEEYPAGAVLIWPVEDMLALGFKLLDLLAYKLRIRMLGNLPLDPLNPPPSLKELFRSYRQTYFGGRQKVFNLYFKYFLQDPLVSILWWSQFFISVLGAKKQLGR